MGLIFDDVHRIANIPIQIAIAGEDLYVGDVVEYQDFDEANELAIMRRRTGNDKIVAGVVGKNTVAGDEFALIKEGRITEFDTSAWVLGDLLYPNATGGIVNYKVVQAGIINQNIGAVIKVGTTDGAMDILVKNPTEKAVEIPYTNTNSGLAADNVKDAIDEVEARSDVSEDRLQTLENKMAGIESGATRDQTPVEIKTLYESMLNTNEYDDAEQFKVAQIAVTQPVDLDFIEKKDEDRRNIVGTLSLPLSHIPLLVSLDYAIGSGNIKFFRAQNTTQGTTYVDRNGTVRYADNDEPRFEQEGLLLEGSSTNLFANFIKYDDWSGKTINVDSSIAPDENTTAGTVTFSTANNGRVFKDVLSPNLNGQDCTFSIWLRGVTGSETCTLKLSDAVTDTNNASETFTLTKYWKRYNVTGKINNIGGYDGYRLQVIGTTGETVNIWGTQLETGVLMTSLIPTFGATKQRNEDICEVDFLDNLMNAEKDYTIMIDVHMPKLRTANKMRTVFGVQGEEHRYFRVSSTGDIETAGLGTATSDKYVSDTFRYMNISKDGVHTGYVNAGGLLITDKGTNNDEVTITGTRKIVLGNAGHGSSTPMFGHLRNYKVYDFALLDEMLRLA